MVQLEHNNFLFEGEDSAALKRLMYCSLCCDVKILHVFLYKSEMHRTSGVYSRNSFERVHIDQVDSKRNNFDGFHNFIYVFRNCVLLFFFSFFCFFV